MIDFTSLMNKSASSATIDPIEIFEKLPKSNTISSLYHIQAEILKKWYSQLRDKRDVVVELNTGGGKTLVGLLIALSTMRELKEGVLYLVENRQLVEQVVAQAKSIGIPAKAYEGRHSVDADYDNGKTILVCSYQALFNGRSVFGVEGHGKAERIGGVIIDDAHASLEVIQEAFSFSIPAEKSAGLYNKILSSFREAFISLDRASTYQDFCKGVGNDIVGIPYPYWHDSIERISSWVVHCEKEADGITSNVCKEFLNGLKFNWPLIKNNLKYCQVIVSRNAITISMLYPRLDMIPSFVSAQRRIYMSATITDYGDMVRVYNLRNLSDDHIISVKTAAGVGRRMILSTPQEVVDDPVFHSLIKNELKRGHGVVRLMSQQGSGLNWNDVEFERPIGHEEVSRAIANHISHPGSRVLSLVNRYNGVDLPGDACRVLMLEGLPLGGNDVDTLMEMYISDSNLFLQRTARRIEQGAGRGVRGASDHCVVLLLGHRLTDWLKRERNRGYFSEAFYAQLKIGDVIAESIKSPSDFCEAMEQDLLSDNDWKVFHASELARLISESDRKKPEDSIRVARLERRAFAQWIEHNNGAACDTLKNIVENESVDPQYRGWLLYLASWIAYDGENKDCADSLNKSAHSHNRALPYAPRMYASESAEHGDRVKAICELVASYSSTGRLLNRFDIDTASLSFDSPHSDFEESLKNLGTYLGFTSRRADNNGNGPDVYWISSEGLAFAFEAKNEKGVDAPLHKNEAGQLRTACDWLKREYPSLDVYPVSVHPNRIADLNAVADNLFVLLPTKLEKLQSMARDLLDASIKVLANERNNYLNLALEQQRLTAKLIAVDYFEHFMTTNEK